MHIGRIIGPDGTPRTGVLRDPPLVHVDGDDAPNIASMLDRLQEQLDEVRALAEAAAPVEHSHRVDDLDGAEALRAEITGLRTRLDAVEDAIEGAATAADLAGRLAGKADADHRHTAADIDLDDRYATVTGGLIDRAALPALTSEDLPKHGHRAGDISGLGSAATLEAHDLNELARRVSALENAGK